VQDYLERYRSHVRKWMPPLPDADRPEAEWGFEEALADDLQNSLPLAPHQAPAALFLGAPFPVGGKLISARAPLPLRHYHCGKPARELWIFLPGIGDLLEDYELSGFIACRLISSRRK
jgi:hypothetical protein